MPLPLPCLIPISRPDSQLTVRDGNVLTVNRVGVMLAAAGDPTLGSLCDSCLNSKSTCFVIGASFIANQENNMHAATRGRPRYCSEN